MTNGKQKDIDECVEQYLKSLKKFKPLKKSEERQLLEAYKLRNDLNARNKLIEHNLKYACKLANNYRDKGLPFSDLISEANNGLLHALEKYDIKQDVKLISYSKWWIIQSMQSALEKQNKIDNSKDELINENIDDEEFFDTNLYDSGNEEYFVDVDFILEEENNYDIINNEYVIKTVTSQISERERDMVFRYYGINTKSMTLEEIGDIYGLTRERVRQIIEKTMTKMRSEAMLIDNSYL